jgi:hypothetical protein
MAVRLRDLEADRHAIERADQRSWSKRPGRRPPRRVHGARSSLPDRGAIRPAVSGDHLDRSARLPSGAEQLDGDAPGRLAVGGIQDMGGQAAIGARRRDCPETALPSNALAEHLSQRRRRRGTAAEQGSRRGSKIWRIAEGPSRIAVRSSVLSSAALPRSARRPARWSCGRAQPSLDGLPPARSRAAVRSERRRTGGRPPPR